MSARTVTLDPVARIEGHLRVDLELQGRDVTSARSSGTSFRGFEPILNGRDPRDAAQITQRVCGVCPVPQARAACAAFEELAGLTVNAQARLLRNLLDASNFIESHLFHFYALSLPDFVSGMPTAQRSGSADVPQIWEGRPGLDASQLVEHAIQALGIRRQLASLAAVIGGRTPHPVGIVPGGATAVVSRAQRDKLRSLAEAALDFAAGPYRDDVETLAQVFTEYWDIGRSGASFVSFGGYPEAGDGLALPAGVVFSEDWSFHELDPNAITESVARSRFELDPAASPASAETRPSLERGKEAYSWVKAPRLLGRVCEVGPLARALVSGISVSGLGVHARHVARVNEANLLAARMLDWIDALEPDASALPDFPAKPDSGRGIGLVEAPRGSLAHFLGVEDGVISGYQIISPTTWNASPRDEHDLPGPIEGALTGLRLADPNDPIEALRVVHSFDPCVQCAVH